MKQGKSSIHRVSSVKIKDTEINRHQIQSQFPLNYDATWDLLLNLTNLNIHIYNVRILILSIWRDCCQNQPYKTCKAFK